MKCKAILGYSKTNLNYDLCIRRKQDTLVSIYGRDRDFFFFVTTPRTALGITPPPIRQVSCIISPEVKRLVREADHSSPPSAEVKNTWNYTSTSPYVFMAWCLFKQRICFHGLVLI
jgi:hypothetical protein